jgi:hypothetical protein
MRVGVGKGKTVEVERIRTFGQSARVYKWFDWVNNKKKADNKAKRLRENGALVRIYPVASGYSIYISIKR